MVKYPKKCFSYMLFIFPSLLIFQLCMEIFKLVCKMYIFINLQIEI